MKWGSGFPGPFFIFCYFCLAKLYKMNYRILYLIPVFLLTLACDNPTEETAQNTGVRQTAQTIKNADSGLTLTVDDQTLQKGAEFCLDIKASNFTDIMSMQYTMNWDPTALQYQDVKNYQLKFLGPNNFGATRSSAGKLSISWFDQELKSISVPDGTSIYQVCYTVIGEAWK